LAKLSAEAISRLSSLRAQTVAVGDVFFVPAPTARYFRSPKGRPALVVRVQRSASGVATLAYLVYGTTERVSLKRAMPVPRGEAGLREDTTFDFGPRLVLPVADLVTTCKPLGRLGEPHLGALETALASSALPFRGLPK
jgi:hypothetical protein